MCEAMPSRPSLAGKDLGPAQGLLCAEALAVDMALLEDAGIAQAKGAYAKARQKSGNVTAKGAAACDEHHAFKQACQCCAMLAIPSRRTRTMPSTPQMVSSRKREGRLLFSLMGTPKARQSQERALVFRQHPLKTACGPVCRNKAAEMPCPAICLPHPEQLLSMKECSEREKALPFPAFLAPYHAKKPRNSPKKNRGCFLAPGNAVWSDCQGLHLAWDAFRAPGN